MLELRSLAPEIRRLSDREPVISFTLGISDEPARAALRLRHETGTESVFIIPAALALALAAPLREQMERLGVRDIRTTPGDGRREPSIIARFLDEEPGVTQDDWQPGRHPVIRAMAVDPGRDVFFLIFRLDEYRMSVVRIVPALLYYLLDTLESDEVREALSASPP